MLDETLSEDEVAARLADSERLAADYRYGDDWPTELPVAGYPALWWRFGLGYGGYRLAIRGTRHDLRHILLDRRADARDDEEWVRVYAQEFGHREEELWACLRYAVEHPDEVERQIDRYVRDSEAYWAESQGERLARDLKAPLGRTKSGRPIDDDVVGEWAVEAERSYDVEHLRPV